jgi:hypothetical protein
MDSPIIYCPNSCENFTKALIKRFTESKISYSLSNALLTKTISNNNVIAIGCYSDSLIKKCIALTPLSLSKNSLTVDSCSYLGNDIRLIFHIPNLYNTNKSILIYTAQDEQNISDFLGHAEKIRDWDFIAYRRIEGNYQEGNMIVAGKFKEENSKITVDSLRVWRKEPAKFYIVKKEQISYLFPENSYEYSQRDSLINLCELAIKKNLAIIGEDKYSEKMQVQFICSAEEMKSYTGHPTAGGQAHPRQKIVYLRSKDGQMPIEHELMHMVVCSAWGYPGQSSIWLNEGFAAYAQNCCSNYTVDQLYTFFSEENMLIPFDSLTSNFYKQPEMIAYHQSAYVVQYLIEKFGIKKLKDLWQSGFQDFEKIFGVPFHKVESDIRQELKIKIPIVPDIDWDILKKGCK